MQTRGFDVLGRKWHGGFGKRVGDREPIVPSSNEAVSQYNVADFQSCVLTLFRPEAGIVLVGGVSHRTRLPRKLRPEAGTDWLNYVGLRPSESDRNVPGG